MSSTPSWVLAGREGEESKDHSIGGAEPELVSSQRRQSGSLLNTMKDVCCGTTNIDAGTAVQRKKKAKYTFIITSHYLLSRIIFMNILSVSKNSKNDSANFTLNLPSGVRLKPPVKA